MASRQGERHGRDQEKGIAPCDGRDAYQSTDLFSFFPVRLFFTLEAFAVSVRGALYRRNQP